MATARLLCSIALGLVTLGAMVLFFVAYADAQFRGPGGAQYSDAMSSMKLFGMVAALSFIGCVACAAFRSRRD